ncbi:YraN family protein [Anaerosporobacter faecicola]|uniref:YraN family protein n=1 Tax=Anaerosporobacter faecicola TaxID=2718714 RepID=UPI00143A23B2|nr:YraN family protein [Anaerosporobacter faecicola]
MGEYNKRVIGSQKEQAAAAFLQEKGYQILTMNYFSRNGEIDIIARDADYLVFVEVKYRKDEKLGLALEAVSERKRKALLKTARYYLYQNGYGEDVKCRFDVVAIQGKEVSLIQNAFEQ